MCVHIRIYTYVYTRGGLADRLRGLLAGAGGVPGRRNSNIHMGGVCWQ